MNNYNPNNVEKYFSKGKYNPFLSDKIRQERKKQSTVHPKKFINHNLTEMSLREIFSKR